MFINGQMLLQYVQYGGMVAYNPVTFVRYSYNGRAVVSSDGELIEVAIVHLSEMKTR